MKVARFQRLDQVRFNDMSAPANVAEDRAGLHGCEALRVEEVVRCRVRWQRCDHRIGLSQRLVHLCRREQLVNVGVGCAGRGAGAGGDGSHSEGRCSLGDVTTDCSKADDGDGAAGQLGPEHRLPLSLCLLFVEGPKVLPDLEQPTHDKFGDAGRPNPARCRQLHPLTADRRQVVLVEPRSGALHPSEVWRKHFQIVRQIDHDHGNRVTPDRLHFVGDLGGRYAFQILAAIAPTAGSQLCGFDVGCCDNPPARSHTVYGIVQRLRYRSVNQKGDDG